MLEKTSVFPLKSAMTKEPKQTRPLYGRHTVISFFSKLIDPHENALANLTYWKYCKKYQKKLAISKNFLPKMSVF